LPSASSALVFGTISVHRIPLRVRDDRDTPLVGNETAMDIELIWVSEKWKYFCKWDWTGEPPNSPSGKSAAPPQ
jgi:hypothetical protein